MKRKADSFLTFFDGEISINEKIYRYGERNISYKRHYAAKTAGVSISKVIHIPLTKDVEINALCSINGTQYIIESYQHVTDSKPPVTVITLSDYGVS